MVVSYHGQGSRRMSALCCRPRSSNPFTLPTLSFYRKAFTMPFVFGIVSDCWCIVPELKHAPALREGPLCLQLHCVKFLVEQRNVEINQLDHRAGWTPLMRVAHMAHHTELPYLATFEYLLQQGADASILGQAITITGIVSGPTPCLQYSTYSADTQKSLESDAQMHARHGIRVEQE